MDMQIWNFDCSHILEVCTLAFELASQLGLNLAPGINSHPGVSQEGCGSNVCTDHNRMDVDPATSFTKSRRVFAGTMNRLRIMPHLQTNVRPGQPVRESLGQNRSTADSTSYTVYEFPE